LAALRVVHVVPSHVACKTSFQFRRVSLPLQLFVQFRVRDVDRFDGVMSNTHLLAIPTTLIRSTSSRAWKRCRPTRSTCGRRKWRCRVRPLSHRCGGGTCIRPRSDRPRRFRASASFTAVDAQSEHVANQTKYLSTVWGRCAVVTTTKRNAGRYLTGQSALIVWPRFDWRCLEQGTCQTAKSAGGRDLAKPGRQITSQ
jgi:hypothetical protein